MPHLRVEIDPEVEAAAVYFSEGFTEKMYSFGDNINVDISKDGVVTIVEFLSFRKLNYTAAELRSLTEAPTKVIEAVLAAQTALADKLAKA
jgi:uncharacterized protein YuzE